MTDFLIAFLIAIIPLPDVNLSGHTCGPAAKNAEVCEQVKRRVAEDRRRYVADKPYVLPQKR